MFSHLMNTFRLQAKVYTNAQFCGHWQINKRSSGQTCFHMVTIGRCRLVMPEYGEHILELGDLVVFPREIAHSMEPFDYAEEVSYPLNVFPPSLSKKGTGLLCGSLNFEHSGFNHLLNALPAFFIIKQTHAPWIAPLFAQIKTEVLRNGGADECVLNRLSELLFMYAFRHQMSQSETTGFLSLFANHALQPALTLMKESPQRSWSLEELGKACSMSRTKFSQLFKKVSGVTVNEFFTWWRMQLAFDGLRQGKRITEIAEQVGYQSESAFSRAFKKCFDMNPSSVQS